MSPLYNIASRFIDRAAEAHPERMAVLCRGLAFTYGELREMTNRYGNAFRAEGCGSKDRVLIALPDSIELVTAFFGAAKIGAIPVPVSPFLEGRDYSYFLSDTQARVVVADAKAAAELTACMKEQRAELMIVEPEPCYPGVANSNRLISSESPTLAAAETKSSDIAFILYSSGSTGLPKGVVHQHKDMEVALRDVAQGVFGICAADRILSVSKLHFAFGMGNGMYFPFGVGASVILNPERPDATKIAALIARDRPTILAAVPSFYEALLHLSEEGLKTDFSSVRFAISAGERLSERTFLIFRERFGIEIVDGLGSTEMLNHFISNKPGAARPGTLGNVVPNREVRLVDPQGGEASNGEPGLLWVKGECAFDSYWNRPELTAQIKRDGWVKTGDMLSRDSQGRYFFHGRADDMIKLQGMWVSLFQVEAALRSLEGIRQASVLPTDTAATKKQLIAYLVCEQGTRITQSAITRQLRNLLPTNAIPSVYVLLNELPLTPEGKLDRRSLPRPSESAQGDSAYTAPQTRTQVVLAQIWSEVLKIARAGVYDDFFSLGGNSISAMQCSSRVRKTFGIELPLDVLLDDTASLEQVASFIEERVQSNGNVSERTASVAAPRTASYVEIN